ncbi:MAG: LytTR family transcriptional regulator DNA-binding domain-containing protein [Bacteroidaceae bacterium]|nr:LytTR family transcriptional regulator DNA-binding domain-containing protein [Bacteroidaceae bacterium]
MAVNLLQNAYAISIYFRTFAPDMNGIQKVTLKVRIISVGITCLAFVVFKPIGLDALGLMLYLHFLAIWVLGVGVCYVTEGVVTHILGIPTSLDKGVEYIIRRNLWFQLINTPLEALFICAYLHFPMSSIGATDPLSWRGVLQAILLLAFCSFIIGLYWRYKFRSRYLALELEETRELNSRLQLLRKEQPDVITLTGSTNEKVMLSVSHLLDIEAVGNYVKVVHWLEGQVRSDMLRATSKQMEDTLHAYPIIVRSHRAFIVNLGQVERVVSKSGSMQLVMKYNHDAIPVSRSNVAAIKEKIKGFL